jgi:hypothetical protein
MPKGWCEALQGPPGPHLALALLPDVRLPLLQLRLVQLGPQDGKSALPVGRLRALLRAEDPDACAAGSELSAGAAASAVCVHVAAPRPRCPHTLLGVGDAS